MNIKSVFEMKVFCNITLSLFIPDSMLFFFSWMKTIHYFLFELVLCACLPASFMT